MDSFTPKNLPSDRGKNPPKPTRSASGFIPFTQSFRGMEDKHLDAATAETSPEKHLSSSIEYVEDQGVVKKIIVTCKCGEVTEIDCLYDAE